MNPKTLPSFVLAATLFAAVASVLPNANAALPLTEITRMQEGAPEKVQIEVTSVKRKEKEKGGGFLFVYRIQAKVVGVERTKSELAVGDEIEIRFSMPNLEKSPAAGDWPSPPEEGSQYEAYLNVANAEKKRYEPAAASGTFEPAVEEKK